MARTADSAGSIPQRESTTSNDGSTARPSADKKRIAAAQYVQGIRHRPLTISLAYRYGRIVCLEKLRT
jgi:hypothetical protein